MLSFVALSAVLLQEAPTLVGFARLPADKFEDGPTSGQFIEFANARQPPFALKQPIQGFSALIAAPGDRVLALSDNGYGTKRNSPDFVLSFRSLRLMLKEQQVRVERTFRLSDPNRKVPWPIVADHDTYTVDSPYPVDATIKEKRYLTGADFDPESFQQAYDGSLWFGDEFGPFLLNTDVGGRLLRAPVALPAVFTPDNPLLCAEPNLRSSKGFEGMTADRNGKKLWLMLEGPLATEPDRRDIRIFEFDTVRAAFSDKSWTYRMESPDHAIGELVHVDRLRFLVIERDDRQATAAWFKRIYLVDLEKHTKELVVDLMSVADPKDANGDRLMWYSMPFRTVEGLTLRDGRTLIVCNDSNYPFGSGRLPGYPEDNEFAVIRLPKPLN